MTPGYRDRAVHQRLAALLLAGAALAGCGGGAGGADGGDRGGATGVTGPVTVLAAASLTDVLPAVATDFRAAHPGASVVFSFAGSSSLATQINEGAPADVFVAADPVTMATVVQAGNAAGSPRVLVRNRLVIAVADGNPHGITGLADLAGPARQVAVCAAQVPCGAATTAALDAAGVDLTPATRERDVRATLAKLTLGEVDAALVYRTDALAVDGVEGVEFPASAAAVNEYQAVTLAGAPNPTGARAFLAHLRSGAAAARFEAAGFEPP